MGKRSRTAVLLMLSPVIFSSPLMNWMLLIGQPSMDRYSRFGQFSSGCRLLTLVWPIFSFTSLLRISVTSILLTSVKATSSSSSMMSYFSGLRSSIRVLEALRTLSLLALRSGERSLTLVPLMLRTLSSDSSPRGSSVVMVLMFDTSTFCIITKPFNLA